MSITDTNPTKQWLVGETGVWSGSPNGGWRRHGPYPFAVQSIVRLDPDLLVGTGHGLWHASQDADKRWVQLHDETLTEVMAVALDSDGSAIVGGSYGVSVCQEDELGLPRWRSLTETRSPDERYTNALCLDQDDLWLAGTEAGVLASNDRGANWQATDLRGSPVRCVVRGADSWLAGTDLTGLWQSYDGHAWNQIEAPFSAAFSVAMHGDLLLVGSFDGIWRRDQDGWARSGPRALIRCLAVSASTWAAGADPGGLWQSTDQGTSWQRTGPFQRVHALCAPELGG